MNNIIKDEMINAKIEDLRSTHCSLMLPWAYFVFKILLSAKMIKKSFQIKFRVVSRKPSSCYINILSILQTSEIIKIKTFWIFQNNL